MVFPKLIVSNAFEFSVWELYFMFLKSLKMETLNIYGKMCDSYSQFVHPRVSTDLTLNMPRGGGKFTPHFRKKFCIKKWRSEFKKLFRL